MKKTILGVRNAMVVFCFTWWLVAGEAWQAAQRAEQAVKQAEQEAQRAEQIAKQVDQASPPAQQGLGFFIHERNLQAAQQAEQASIMADAHWRTQRSWGIGAGLLAVVLPLVGVLVWSKLTAKP